MVAILQVVGCGGDSASQQPPGTRQSLCFVRACVRAVLFMSLRSENRVPAGRYFFFGLGRSYLCLELYVGSQEEFSKRVLKGSSEREFSKLVLGEFSKRVIKESVQREVSKKGFKDSYQRVFSK